MKNQIHFDTKMEVKNYRKKGKIKQNQNLQQKIYKNPNMSGNSTLRVRATIVIFQKYQNV